MGLLNYVDKDWFSTTSSTPDEIYIYLPKSVIISDEYTDFCKMCGGSAIRIYMYLRSYIQRRSVQDRGKKIYGQREFMLERYYDNHLLATRWPQISLAKKFNCSERYIRTLIKKITNLDYIQKDEVDGKVYYILGMWDHVGSSIKEVYFMDELIKQKTFLNRKNLLIKKVDYWEKT
jgi:hypothetical protein